jgi:ribosomal protein S27E
MTQSDQQFLAELLDSGRLDEAIAMRGSASSSPRALDLIDCAERRKALIEKFQGGEARASQIACPQCHMKLRVVSPSSQSVSCYGCHTLTDLKTLSAVDALIPCPQKSALKIGMEGSLGGTRVQIIGRAIYNASIREWDSEDKTYENGSWRWTEWSLLTAAAEVWYLCIDDEGYSLSTSFTPQEPCVPGDISDKLNFTGGPFMGGGHRIEEWGEARIIAAEGEFSWIPSRSETIQYAEYSDDDRRYGVEWRRGTGASAASEAEFYQAAPIGYPELLRAFSLSDLLSEWEQVGAYRAQLLRWAVPFLLIGAIFISAGMVSEASGRTVYQTQIPSLSALPDEGVLRGPFRLSQAASVHQIRFAASIPDNSEIWTGVELLDENQDAINASDGDLWRESGYDEGEYWSESDLTRRMTFYLRKPGSYYVRVFGEADPLKPADGSLAIEVREGATAARPYFISGIIMLVVGLLVSPLVRGRMPRRRI